MTSGAGVRQAIKKALSVKPSLWIGMLQHTPFPLSDAHTIAGEESFKEKSSDILPEERDNKMDVTLLSITL